MCNRGRREATVAVEATAVPPATLAAEATAAARVLLPAMADRAAARIARRATVAVAAVDIHLVEAVADVRRVAVAAVVAIRLVGIAK